MKIFTFYLKIISLMPLFVSFAFISCSKIEGANGNTPVQKSLSDGTANGGDSNGGTATSNPNNSNTSTADDCVLNIPDPEFIDPSSPPPGMSMASQGKWNAVLAKSATPRLPARRYFYRWGNPTYEAPRIGANPIFTIYPVNNVNVGIVAGGTGLYLTPTPLGAAGHHYAINPNRLYTVSIAKNTPVFDNTLIPGILQNDVTWLDSNVAGYSGHVLPILHSYYWNYKFRISTLNRGSIIQINKPMTLPRAWILKTSIGAQYEEEFTGKELSTQTLIDTIADSNRAGPPPAAGGGGALVPRFGPAGKASVREYYLDRIRPTLSKRIFNPDPNYVEILPTPKTVTVERHNWGADPNLAVCGSLPPTARTKFFWRYDGSCGEYTETGKTLLRNDVPKHNCYGEWHAQTYSYCKKYSDHTCYKYLKVNVRTFIITDRANVWDCPATSPFCDEKAGVIP